MKNQNNEKENEYLIHDEPPRFLRRHLEEILVYATRKDASDITFQTNCRIIAEIHGKLYKINRHELSQAELEEFAAGLYKSEEIRTKIKAGSDADGSYDIKVSRDERFRYRFNITAVQSEGVDGIQITCRTIIATPPSISEMKLEDDILNNFAPKQGLVVVTGATGSGKSTLLSSMIRHVLEDPDGHKKVLTYESPIEYVYDNVITGSASIAQSEIPRHLPSFAAGIRNALRRKPSIILIGEARDGETIGESITAAMTGHLVYTTVHSNGFADTIRRMVNAFHPSEKNSRAVDLISSMKMVISQMLLPSTDGKRVAIREYLIFNEEIINELIECGLDNLTATARKMLIQHGRTFLQDAMEKHEQGLIADKELNMVKQINRGMEEDIKNILKRQNVLFDEGEWENFNENSS